MRLGPARRLMTRGVGIFGNSSRALRPGPVLAARKRDRLGKMVARPAERDRAVGLPDRAINQHRIAVGGQFAVGDHDCRSCTVLGESLHPRDHRYQAIVAQPADAADCIAGDAVAQTPILGVRASASAANHSFTANVSRPARRTASRPSLPRNAAVCPSLATRMSGWGVARAQAIALAATKAPPQRNGVRKRQTNSRPVVPSRSGPIPKAGMRPTAPGSDATHRATAFIHSIPCPIICQNAASKPKGMLSTPRMPIGMTTPETTGMASRLATTP